MIDEEKKNIYQNFLDDIESLSLKNLRILIGVSGGQDSSVLLHLCSMLPRKFRVFGLYVNHNLRNSAIAEEEFAKKKSKIYNIPIYIFRSQAVKPRNQSIEMHARKIRYLAFEKYIKKLSCDIFLTAHHANDNLETILMRLNDGAGLAGIRGIPKRNGFYYRPLLNFKKKSLEDFQKNENVDFIVDETNTDVSIKRNFYRHKLVAPWENQAPKLVDNFISISKKAAKIEKRLTSVLYLICKDINFENDILKLKSNFLNNYSTNQKILIIKYLVNDFYNPWRQNFINSLKIWIIKSKSGSRYKLFNNYLLLKNRNEILIKKNTLIKKELLNKKGKLYFNKHNFVKINKVSRKQINFSQNNEYIDEKYIQNKKLNLRLWKSGDSFRPLGMKNLKKISDFLIDQKINCFEKEKQLVLTADDEIIWVCNHRLSDNVKITYKTESFLELSFKARFKNESIFKEKFN
ncbi:MAG: tRNA lysidine(34) synthetase TilS [bacterium TMED144]|nr:MAG: tRNA lysidine(34) synthetase TilS [bacterium TMED144]|tara:strand:+ start:48 stop:1430 length:1383 start_codon:yes stop_codon:yes gene_type:complete